MSNRVANLFLAAAIVLTAQWCRPAAGDEPAGQSSASATKDANAENPLAEVANERRAPAAAPRAEKTSEPITIRFQYGDAAANLGYDLMDGRPVTAETTVGSLLSKAAKSTPFKGSEATITVLRPRAVVDNDLNVSRVYESFAVEWDAQANRPTEATNRQLQPGDRLLVKLPAPSIIHPPRPGAPTLAILPSANGNAVVAFPAPQTAPYTAGSPDQMQYSVNPLPTTLPPTPAYSTAPAATPPQMLPQAPPRIATVSSAPAFFGPGFDGVAPQQMLPTVREVIGANGERQVEFNQVPVAVPQQIIIKLQIFADLKDNMVEFASLHTGGFLLGDAETLRGAARIMEKNGLIETRSRPSMVCTLGRPAEFSVGATVPAADPSEPPQMLDGTRISVTPLNFAGRLRLNFDVRVAQNGRINALQTACEIGRGQSLVAALGKNDDGKPLYLMLTPEQMPAAEVQAPAPMPAPAVASPIPATWQPQPQPAAVPYSVAEPSKSSSNDPNPVRPTQFAAPAPRDITTIAPIPTPDAPPARRPTIQFDITVLEDPSGSLAAFMPPAGQPPCQLADTQTMCAALRILDKQKLVRRIADPQIRVVSGERASLQIGSESPNKDAPSQGLQIDVLGRQMGGGMAIEFKLLQTEKERKLNASIDLLVADGQSIIAQAHWQEFAKKPAGEASQSSEPSERQPEKPVYVVITPQIVR